MRHKILKNVFFGIMVVFLVSVIVIISAIHKLCGLTIVEIIMNLKYQLVAVFAISVVLALVLSKIIYNSVINPINAINVENPDEEVEFDEIRPLVDKINTQNRPTNRWTNLKQKTKSRTDCDVNLRQMFLTNLKRLLPPYRVMRKL